MKRIVTALVNSRLGSSSRRTSRAGSLEIEVLSSFEETRGAWEELAERAAISPYQYYLFLSAWSDTIGRAEGARPFLIVARNACGRPLALLPLCIRRRWGLNFALFLGGRDSNFNLPLLDPSAGFVEADLRALIREAARRAPTRLDLIYLRNQPKCFGGAYNPLAFETAMPSASFAYGATLPARVEELAARLSKDTRKKLRKKEARLAQIGPLSYEHCATGERAREIIDALIAQKTARFIETGAANACDLESRRVFLSKLSAGAGEDGLELHALCVGERIVATYAGIVRCGRFSAMLNSFDADSDIARASPGDLLLHALMRNLVSRGVTHFDLGAGEARYKSAVCDETIELCDVIIATSPRGVLAAGIFLAFLRIKRYIKQTPALATFYHDVWRSLAKWG